LNGPVPEEPGEKRVSWVELYFDLIFVFAVGETTQIMVAVPHWSGFGRALGLFVPLWWTWIGFVVLYNRNPEDRASRRLFTLAGTLPCAVAAVETHAAAGGHGTAFMLALAAARLVLALAFAFTPGQGRQVAIGYGVSTVAFAVSAFLPGPWCYALWAFALIQEAGFLLLRDGERSRDRTREGGEEHHARRSRTESLRAMLRPPADPARRVDAAHLAERFGLMIIILLGEVVVAVGASAADVTVHGPRYWLGLLGGLFLAATLWWIYFTAAAPMSEYVLRASGGNPNLAYGLYAGGHLSPAFALLTMAAGVDLALSGEPPMAAAWFVTGGLAGYLMGSRALAADGRLRSGPLLRGVVVVATVCLALLRPLISTTGVVLAAAVWAAVIAGYVTWRLPVRLKDIADDPLAYFRPPPPGEPPPGEPPAEAADDQPTDQPVD
jgi:low temperature requirement protein LtrA